MVPGRTSEADARAVLKAAQENAAREDKVHADARAAWKAAQEKAAREEKMGADREPELLRLKANIKLFLADFLAGAVAATISTALTYPFHRGVALIQLEGANPVLGTPATPFKGGFFGFFDAMRQTSSSLGVLANYRGANYAIIAPLLTKPLNFAIKDNIKTVLGFPEYNPKTEFWSFFAANMASGVAAGVVTIPGSYLAAWPVKIAQADLRPEGSRSTGFGHLKGLLGAPGRTLSLMVRAAPLHMVGIVAYRGPYFGIYDTLKHVNPYKNDRGATGLFSKFVIAQATAIIAGVLAYPFGLVVSRFVVANAPGVTEQGKHVTIGETYRSLVSGHGVVRGLWRGWPSQFTCTFASGLMLVAYDEVKALLHG